MKQIYEQPEMMALPLEVMDIVTLSPGTNEPGGNKGSYGDTFGE